MSDETPDPPKFPPLPDPLPPPGPLPPTPLPPNGPLPRRNLPSNATLVLIVMGIALVGILIYQNSRVDRREIAYNFFHDQLAADNILGVEFKGQTVEGIFKKRPVAPPPLEPDLTIDSEESKPHEADKGESKTAKPTSTAEEKTKPEEQAKKKEPAKPELLPLHFYVTLPPINEEPTLLNQLLAKKVHIGAEKESDGSNLILWAYYALFIIMIVSVYFMWRRTRDQFMGGGILSGFSRSPAKRYDATKRPVTFADVAGLEGVKNDLQEIVEFLKNPENFQRLGGRVPKGVLLMGPPGTGKTLLARAVAGEAGVPFYSISASEFIQMFVGVGASRVRDMFRTAKENSPCILFIDEIDAIGRHRGAGLGGGHDEREQTLNQILSEMDGFSQTESVIVLAATNRPDVLDPALLRPGRFDRHVTVDRPNFKGRVAIFRVHTRNVPLAPNVNLDRLAAGSVGLTGADIRNLVNEAALWATRNGKDSVEMDDFEYARDKILMGPKREEILNDKEKRMTAYHESGHALLAWLLPGTDRLHKVTIIPRGRALGVTQLLPEEDKMSIGETELHNRLVFTLGGRAAEKLVFNEYSAGAENDLTQVTKLARRMVANWGMSERLGPVSYRTSEEHPFLGREISEHREYSEHTACVIDEEVSQIIHTAAERASQLLSDHRSDLDKLAAALEESEILDEEEIEALLGPPAYRPRELKNSPEISVP
ncbi:MAG TPA: ATP-dependent zinc metalloprotease FtsH [Pirellulales bacterium]|jgi:cell division protease FtsH|nr:ATP-dependent zinc metalloprotease FtsH [Pirellulales bacterium]